MRRGKGRLFPHSDFRARELAAKAAKKEKKLTKLLDFIRKQGSATNNEIQKHLGISDATATRYAQELVRRGLLKKTGATRAVKYQLI